MRPLGLGLGPYPNVVRQAQYSLGPGTANVKLSNTQNFRNTYRAGVRNTRVAAVGSSLIAGQSTGGGATQAVNAWIAQLATKLSAAGIPAGANNIWGDHGSWGAAQNITNYKAGDGRVVTTGAAALGSVLSSGGNNFQFDAAGTLVFTPQGNTNTAQIIVRDGAAGRNWDWSVDGGAATDITSTGVTQFRAVPAALGSVASHAIQVSWDLGAVHLLGIEAWDATRKEISCLNWGICGGSSTNIINNTDAAVGRLAILAHSTLKPDLVFLEGGLPNDWRQSFLLATSRAQLKSYIDTCQTNNVDVILTVPNVDLSSTGLAGSQQLWVDMMYELAFAENVGIMNTRAANPTLSDTIHPTTAGYSSIADLALGVIKAII